VVGKIIVTLFLGLTMVKEMFKRFPKKYFEEHLDNGKDISLSLWRSDNEPRFLD
jgi:hypothetical protein